MRENSVQLKAANPLIQQQLPVEDWGTNVVGFGFAGRMYGDSYRILAAYTNTTITITGLVVTVESTYPSVILTSTNGTVMVTITNAGQFYDLIIDGPAWFRADKPIQVAHFANGTEFDHSTPPFEGDPCEILLPPTGHYLQTNIVFTLPNDNTAGGFDKNFLNLIVPQSATNSTYVDGSLVAATNFFPITASGYYGAEITITNSGTHTITGSQPVGVEIYGFGITDAYGYSGGVSK